MENMRRGMSPEEAGMDALKRIVHNYNNDMSKLIYVSMHFYILRQRWRVCGGFDVVRIGGASGAFCRGGRQWPGKA